MRQSNHRNGESGTSLFIGTISLVFLVPLIGLFIDVGILYSAKARLQAAVDGAALAAARSLNLGQTTDAQATTAKQNAVNWFYANFPPGNWSTTGTVMTTASVTVQDDPNNPQLRDVTLSASTQVPTWFMRWFNVNSTALNANGQASRRDVVAMMVLDRSGSMCNGHSQPCGLGDGTPCDSMLVAAKTFVGEFAAGRDRIGMATFDDKTNISHIPSTDFQTQLGYTNSSGSGTGAIDHIKCGGGTGTPAALSLAYNELYKMNLPGALNLIVLETDGLPNTVVYHYWDGTNFALQGSGCKDINNKTKSGGGWRSSHLSDERIWMASHSMNTGGTGYMSDIPAGAYGEIYANDPSQGNGIRTLWSPWGVNDTDITADNTTDQTGCNFGTNQYGDFAWLPTSDVFGNSVNPANAYQSITITSGHVPLSGTLSTDWTNVHAAALNATDNAAYRIRTNANLPAYIFTLGLGGNGDIDKTLLQRIANDPNADMFNNPPQYTSCATTTGCVNYSTQPQGMFIYSPDSQDLGQAFLKIASQVLRLSR